MELLAFTNADILKEENLLDNEIGIMDYLKDCADYTGIIEEPLGVCIYSEGEYHLYTTLSRYYLYKE